MHSHRRNVEIGLNRVQMYSTALPQSSYKVCCLIGASLSCYILRPTDKHAGAKKSFAKYKAATSNKYHDREKDAHGKYSVPSLTINVNIIPDI